MFDYCKKQQLKSLYFTTNVNLDIIKKKKIDASYRQTEEKKLIIKKTYASSQKFLLTTNLKKIHNLNVIYLKHFSNMFIKCGKKQIMEKNLNELILICKRNNINLLVCLYKCIYFFQFTLLLKGYRYKVGRGVIKHKYILTPISIDRQIFLSFFYFQQSLKRYKYGKFMDFFLSEMFELLYFDHNNTINLLNNLYDLAYQSRMFTAKQIKKRKKSRFQKKLSAPKILFLNKI